MAHDFTTHVNRANDGSFKWDSMLEGRPDLPADVIPLSVADMEFATAEPIKRALHELVDSSVLGYTGGTDAFYDACTGWQQRRHTWKPEREWIVTSPGVVPALHMIVRALTKPGDGIIIQQPVYYPFVSAVEKAGNRRVVNNALVMRDGRYEMDLDDLAEKASDPANTMLILCSPHNPVGRVWDEETLRRLVEICSDNNVTVVSDEIHDDLIMPGHEHITLARVCTESQLDNVIVCTAPSKTFNLAGCQASIIYIPGESVRKRVKAEFDSSSIWTLNCFAYAATRAAYDECGGWLDDLICVVWDNYLLLRAFCERHSGLVCHELEGTYLAWVDFNAWGMEPEELERFMKDEALLFLDEGTLFGPGGEGFERFNLACPHDLFEAALNRLDSAIARTGVETK